MKAPLNANDTDVFNQLKAFISKGDREIGMEEFVTLKEPTVQVYLHAMSPFTLFPYIYHWLTSELADVLSHYQQSI